MPRKAKPKTLRCPSCKAIVLVSEEQFPFCSDRCRIIDLGKWASGAYRISSPIHDPESLEEMKDAESKSSADDDGETIH